MFSSIKARWLDWLDEHPHIDRAVSLVVPWLPPLNYITVHYTYFIVVTMASSVVFWGSSQPFGAVSYVDSLFQVTSAMTNTGLNTRNLSEFTTWQQVILWFLLMLGSNMWVSFWTVMIRKHAFEKRFDNIVEVERERRKRRRELRKESGQGISRAQALGNMLSFSKYTSNPNEADVPLPGLGSRVPGPNEPSPSSMELSNVDPDADANASKTASAPLATIPSSDDGSDEKIAEREKPALTLHPSSGHEAEDARDHISFVEPTSPRGYGDSGNRVSAYQHDKHLAPGSHHRRRSSDMNTITTAQTAESEDFMMHWKKILGQHNVSRSGQFYDLSSDEREHLGGCEYRALKILSLTVPMYAILWQFLGAVALGCWIGTRTPKIPESYGENPWWSGIFASVSSFNNGGFALTDDSLIPFQGDVFVLFVVGLLILAGNTAYPIFLRLILWSILKLLQLTTTVEAFAPWKETLEFILKYPRRVYTTLFPSRATWWLLGVLFATNVIDWLAFEVLNIGNAAVKDLPVGRQIMIGLFQAISVRACGFAVIAIPSLYIGVQVLYLIMMYISVYPVVITMRNSNVYEERSLGIYDDNDPAIKEQNQIPNPFAISQEPEKKPGLRRRKTAAVVNQQLRRASTFQGVGARRENQGEEDTSRISFIGQQIRGQLAHDLWWLVLAIMIIVIIETDQFLRDPVTFSVFNILFESVSAYACVGLSVGLPNDSYALSGALHTGSKLVLCLVMLRGRHRGLPVAIDRAVRLPGDELQKDEAEDNKIRRTKTMQRMSRDG